MRRAMVAAVVAAVIAASTWGPLAVATGPNVPPGAANVVCYEEECFSLFPTPHCALCCVDNTCKDNDYSCQVCDCRDPLCKYEVSHCVPAPGQNTTSQPWPVEIPGVCCDAGKVGPHCADCGPGYFGTNCTRCPGNFLQPCSLHGTCDGSGTHGGNGKCTCDNGWLGPACSQCNISLWECPGKLNGTGEVCSGRGNCSCYGALRNETTCTCEYQFAGDDCGQCNAGYRTVNGSAECGMCQEGYFGNSPGPGEDLVCSLCPQCPGHGVCDGSGTSGGSFSCRCTGDYTGALCNSTPTNWLVVGPILGGVGLVLCLCICWRVWVCKRNEDEWAESQAKERLLAAERAAAAKAAKKKKKRDKRVRHKSRRRKRRDRGAPDLERGGGSDMGMVAVGQSSHTQGAERRADGAAPQGAGEWVSTPDGGSYFVPAAGSGVAQDAGTSYGAVGPYVPPTMVAPVGQEPA